jgi:hypothetical protein
MQSIPRSLINDFMYEKVVVFAGAGLSACANLPLWGQLINAIKHNLMDLSNEEEDFFSKLDSLQQAQYMYDKIGQSTVFSEVSKIFSSNEKQSLIHDMFVTLPIRKIITTNWDTLIEDYFFNKVNLRIKILWKDNQIPTVGNYVTLIKMHGTISDPDSIVFSEEDYYSFLITKPLLRQYISTLVATSTILFIGYSYNDLDFKFIYNNVKANIQPMGNNAYIFLPNASQQQINYLKDRGLQVISYSGVDSHKALFNFLSDLVDKVSITATNSLDRMKILLRENVSMLSLTGEMIIRNQSNLGPLGTPDFPSDKYLYGAEELTNLEVECTKIWKRLLDNGATAKCIICLDKKWIMRRYTKTEIIERLNALKSNIMRYKGKVEIVDLGFPLRTNIGIFNKEVCLESKKIGHLEKSYNKLSVIRDHHLISSYIDDFDLLFDEVKIDNLSKADASITNDSERLETYIFGRIDSAINELR